MSIERVLFSRFGFCRGQLILVAGWLCALSSYAQSADSTRFRVHYGDKGFEFRTAGNEFLLQIQSRLQFRFATPADQDPVTFDDFIGEPRSVFKVNRARLKVGGHAYKTWLKYYWEYELSQSNLLDFRIMIERWKWMHVKVGQWKVEFTRERFISSGEQQLVDRSLINRAFTIDRQQGITIYGHLDGKGAADVNYWVAVLTGTGRGNSSADDNDLMYFGRLQWNFLGREVTFEGSDLDVTPKPAAIVAVAAVTNRSPYTRFSQAGGGALEGFEVGAPGQYRVNQINLETAFKYRGFSWQSEMHWKDVINKLDDDAVTHFQGYYVQAGYLFHQWLSWWPKPLELAARHATYRPHVNLDDDAQTESSLDLNWFFNGHKNKLTAEVTHFNFLNDNLDFTKGWRYRLQWEISL